MNRNFKRRNEILEQVKEKKNPGTNVLPESNHDKISDKSKRKNIQ